MSHLQATVEWFKIYKMPDGKPANEFAFNSEPKNKEFAENIIAGCHESWKKLSRYSFETDKIDNLTYKLLQPRNGRERNCFDEHDSQQRGFRQRWRCRRSGRKRFSILKKKFKTFFRWRARRSQERSCPCLKLWTSGIMSASSDWTLQTKWSPSFSWTTRPPQALALLCHPQLKWLSNPISSSIVALAA